MFGAQFYLLYANMKDLGSEFFAAEWMSLYLLLVQLPEVMERNLR